MRVDSKLWERIKEKCKWSNTHNIPDNFNGFITWRGDHHRRTTSTGIDLPEITPEQFLGAAENTSTTGRTKEVVPKIVQPVIAREMAQTKMLQADDQGARDAQGYTGRKETIVWKTHHLEYWHKGRLVMRGSFEEKPQEVDYSDLYRANSMVEL